jgi:hypothetical protein
MDITEHTAASTAALQKKWRQWHWRPSCGGGGFNGRNSQCKGAKKGERKNIEAFSVLFVEAEKKV